MLPAGYQDWCERVLEDDEIIELRNRFQVIRNTWDFHTGPRRGIARPIPREHELAIWITLATLVRINEICAAEWRTHINFEKATWFIPASQSKNRRAFTIHLSAFALRLLRELRELTGHTPYLLPHTKEGGKPATTAMLQCAIGSRQSHGKKWNRKYQNAEITACSLRANCASLFIPHRQLVILIIEKGFMQLANSKTSSPRQTKACTSVRAAADAKLIRKSGNLYRVRLDLIQEEEGFNPRDYSSAECREKIR
jgi:hypothetical protein